MKSYFKFLSRNKLYSIVELLGLSIALGFVVLLISYARTEFSVGAHQPDAKNIWAIGSGDSVGMTLGTGEELFPGIPEIASWTRVADYGTVDIIAGEYAHSVTAAALDTNFLKIFDYSVSGCDRDRILAGKNEALVSESFARSTFGADSPIGKTFTLGGEQYAITGTMEDFGPYDEFSHYDIFLSMKVMEEKTSWMDEFGSVQTFITLADGADPDAVSEKLLDKYMGYWEGEWERDSSDGAFLYGSTLTRFDKIYFTDLDCFSPLRKGDKSVVRILLLIAVVLLASAIFNYINLTVAQTGKRAKEMATRRLLGESTKEVVFRYVAESFIFTAGCFVLGCLLAIWLKSRFEGLLSTEIVLAADAAGIAVGAGLLVLISFVSALLPAAMVLKFKPADVVKGDFRLRDKLFFSKIFIICQNVISTVLIAVSLTMVLQMRHMVNLPTGYDTKDLITISTYQLGVSNSAAQQAFADRLSELPQVQKVGLYGVAPFACGASGVHIENESTSWLRLSRMDSTAFNMLGFKILEQYSEPVDGSCWMSEDAKQRYGVSADKPYVGDGGKYKCCGIIADFRVNNALDEPLEDSHSAVMIQNGDQSCFGMIIKATGDHKEAIEAVRGAWISFAGEYLGVRSEPRGLDYVDDYMNDVLTGSRNTMTLVMTFMLLAVLISMLGLFAMAVYYTGQQTHEIAVRKIFGSGVNEAAAKLSKSFAIMTVCAVVIAVPICIWAMRFYLEGFPLRIGFPWWVIPAAAALTCVISFVSIVTQTLRTARANPVDALKRQD